MDHEWLLNLIKSKELWLSLLGSAFGAGFGAWFGAKLSIWQKNIDEHNSNFSYFKNLIFRILSLRDNVLNYKREIVVEKLKGLQDQDLRKTTKITFSDAISFNVDLSKYYFIGDKNPSIISLIIEIDGFVHDLPLNLSCFS